MTIDGPSRPNPLARPPGTLPGAKPVEQGDKQAFEAFLKKAQNGERAATADDKQVAVRQAAEQFESFFLSQIFKSMRETVPEGLFDGGFSGETYTEMLDQEHARSLSEKGGIGLADVLERQLQGTVGNSDPL